MNNPLFELDMQPTRPLDRSEIFPEDYHHPGYVPGIDDWQAYCSSNNLNPDNGKLRSEA